MTDITHPPAPELDPLVMRSALEQLRERLDQLSERDIVATPGLDATQAIAIAMGCLPRLARLRDAVVLELGERHAAVLDELRLVVFAAAQASFELVRYDAQRDLGDACAEVVETHGVLLADADALVRRRLLDGASVDECRATVGYVTVVGSTIRLAQLFRKSWPAIAGRTVTTLDDLERAESKAQAFMTRVTERDSGKARQPADDLRARAMTLLFRTYRQVRRVIAFVRYDEGDAEMIAPSLWSQRRGRQRAPKKSTSGPVPVLAGPTNGGGPFTE